MNKKEIKRQPHPSIDGVGGSAYLSTISYLYNAAPMFSNIGAGAYKEGLATTKALDAHFGHPHRHFRTIHVAGTNGKGSVSSTLAAILQAAGLKVGLYTSPHLVDFRERIRVNGEMISEDRVVRFVEDERAFFEPLSPSFFELTTALAFKYFEEEGVDVAVVEVGLGGRLDCTNIIHPDISIITNISFDHQQFLGDTLPLIAGEKAGIIKRRVPVVIGETNGHADVRSVFATTAQVKHTTIRFADEEQFEPVACQLKGDYQQANMRTVHCAVDSLRRQRFYRPLLTDEAVAYGMQHVMELTGFQGRWQVLHDSPTMVCDAGHNAAGITYVAGQLAKELDRLKVQGKGTLRIVFGMVSDKDYEFAVNALEALHTNAIYYFTQPSCKRALPADVLAKTYIEKGLPVSTYPSVREAVAAALADATPDDFIFVGGSCYVVADLLTNIDAIFTALHI